MIESVPLDALYPNPWQPRRNMDDDDVAALADNIAAIGRVLHTPNVRANPLIPDTYQIAEGHQRIEALRVLYELECGWPNEATVNIEDFSDVEMAEIALSENGKRTDITPLDQLYALSAALNIEGMNITRLAETAGIDRTTISKRLPVLLLPDAVLGHVDSGACSIEAAREFVALLKVDIHEEAEGLERLTVGHAHEDVIEYVVERALVADREPAVVGYDFKNATYRPDFRRHRVREFIHDAINGHNDLRKGWRLVDTEGRHHYTDPTFDLERFREMYKDHVHRLPTADTNKFALWTCATREWTKWQMADSRSRSAGKPTNGAKPKKEPSRWLRQVRRDTLVVEVLGERKAAQLGTEEPESDLGRNLADEARERLGERIKNGAGALLQPDIPGFDYDECRTCPLAGYRNHGRWTPPSFVCRDSQRFLDKKSRAIGAWTAAFQAARAAAAAEDLNAEQALRNMIEQKADPYSLDILLQALWRGIRDVRHIQAAPRYPKSNFWPQAAEDLAKLLKVELPPVNAPRFGDADDFRTQAAAALNEADEGTKVVATALMGAWAYRIARGLDVPVVEGGVGRPTPPSQDGAGAEEKEAANV